MDRILRATAADGFIKMSAVSAKETVQRAKDIHNCTPTTTAALGRTLMDAAPLGLTVGDYYNGAAWTRNIDGEQVVLPVGVSADVAEALAILNGEEEGNADAE